MTEKVTEDIDFRKYVNMESEMFKGKSSSEVWVLLSPDSRWRLSIRWSMDEMKKALSGLDEH